MSGDDTGYRYGLAVSLFDYFRDDHPWRHKSPAELTIADIVREVEVTNSRMARMTVMVKNLTAMTGIALPSLLLILGPFLNLPLLFSLLDTVASRRKRGLHAS